MRFRRTVEECPGFPRFPCLPVEVVEKIIHMCWLKDMGEDDHRINGGLVYPNFDNINPAKTWAIKKRIWALSQVNKHLNQLCHQLLWNIVYVEDFRGTTKRLLRETKARPKQLTTTLYLQFQHKVVKNHDERRRMLRILEHLKPKLERLGIDNFEGNTPWLRKKGTPNLLHYFSQSHFPALKEIDIRDMRFCESDQHEKLNLTDETVAHAFQNVQQLVHFRGHYISGVNANLVHEKDKEAAISPLASFLASQKDLVTLKLIKSNCMEFNWNLIKWIPQLHTLHLHDVGRKFRYDWMVEFVHKFSTTLKHLQIWDTEVRWGGERFESDKHVFNLPHLESLSLSVVCEQPAEWLPMFSQECQNLRRLELRGMATCQTLIKALEAGCWPKLKEVRVTVMTEKNPMRILRAYCEERGYSLAYSECIY